MVQGIRVAQESYHSETQQYASISGTLDTGASATGHYYPLASPNGTQVTAWGATCGSVCNANMDWSLLPLHVDGPVMFGYETVAGVPGPPTPTSVFVNGQTVQFPAQSATDWFIVGAGCDLDGIAATVTHVYTTSWTNQVLVDEQE